MLTGCTDAPDRNYLLKRIENDVNAGNLKKAITLADSLKKVYPGNSRIVHKADSLSQIAERIAIDFSVTGELIASQLERHVGKFTPEDQAKWEKTGWLEYRVINGEKRYFKRAASNLKLIKNFHLGQANRDSLITTDPNTVSRIKHSENIINSSDKLASPAAPVEIDITYTIKVKPDVVPEGETVRCWLPFPKENHPRQSEVYLLLVSNENFIISPDSVTHRTIYMETKAEKGLPVIFRISCRYQSHGQYFDPANIKILPYNKSSSLYKEYTSEQLPQICFTENVRHLADSLAGSEEDQYKIVKKIYYWFCQNILWTAAPEYSIMPIIPEYVIHNERGDCGMQTFLFMSMLRYKGIPVKWQSGWMVPPGDETPHDWCEVYYEGTGWVPTDLYFGLQNSNNIKTREFYISGIDSYRFIVNDDVSGNLYPEKKFLRSDPFDFQRGEVEWKGGNLYFDKWNYEMKIDYKTK